MVFLFRSTASRHLLGICLLGIVIIRASSKMIATPRSDLRQI